MLIYQPPIAPTSIPVIDLSPSFSGDPDKVDAVAREIHKACREMGFFYISHHGIDQTLIDAAFEWAARFYDLPFGEKKALSMKQSAAAAGYEIGEQQLDSQTAGADKSPPDLKESFSFGMELPADHPLSLKRLRNYGHNQWPALPGFRELMLRYQADVQKLADHLLRLVARSLDLPADWFVPHFQAGAGSIRLLKYPPQPASAPQSVPEPIPIGARLRSWRRTASAGSKSATPTAAGCKPRRCPAPSSSTSAISWRAGPMASTTRTCIA